MGNVGWRATEVGSGSVGCGVGLGKCGIVAVGEGVGESAMVASALPGVANRSATTSGSVIGSPSQAASKANSKMGIGQR